MIPTSQTHWKQWPNSTNNVSSVLQTSAAAGNSGHKNSEGTGLVLIVEYITEEGGGEETSLQLQLMAAYSWSTQQSECDEHQHTPKSYINGSCQVKYLGALWDKCQWAAGDLAVNSEHCRLNAVNSCTWKLLHAINFRQQTLCLSLTTAQLMRIFVWGVSQCPNDFAALLKQKLLHCSWGANGGGVSDCTMH